MAPSILDSKCVLVIGATSGIGRALAREIHKLPAPPTVIAAGRRKERLEELAADGFHTVELDVDIDHLTLGKHAKDIIAKYPELDTIILCAGIQWEFDFTGRQPGKGHVKLDDLYKEVNVNYLSVVALVTHFLPHFLGLSSPTRPCFIIPVTSGLAIVPASRVINYSASKAALHSFSVSLGMQLKDTNIHVLEIIPPLVESELHDAEGTTEALSKIWMPLDFYMAETMEGLKQGKTPITSGMAAMVYEKFEKEKLPIIANLAKS